MTGFSRAAAGGRGAIRWPFARGRMPSYIVPFATTRPLRRRIRKPLAAGLTTAHDAMRDAAGRPAPPPFFHQLLRETPSFRTGRKGVLLTGSFFPGLGLRA
ncbi:hypothetical protein [Burkholderia orbicola]|uniref:hypothetical protein n=1 Tax=Burkholderia orbicola TaxID=2978683 RepID=UPI001907EB34|nr:hypothetical protein [Burkholderia orbicola]MBK1819192.1 hypothetical protein [Burkholderia orbicola]